MNTQSKHTSKFQLAFDGSISIDVLGFWPDGKAPERPTAEDAARMVAEYIDDNGITRFLEDWNLTDVLKVWVSGVKVPS